MTAQSSDPNARLRVWHLASALIILAFLCLHIGNHLFMLAGANAHIAAMDSLRPLYRNPVSEVILLLACLFQIVSGLTMVVRSWRKRRGFVPWTQAISGLVLAVFLMVHISAVLSGRFGQGLDTNFWFASAGFHAGLAWFFVPYYFLAVSALFVHLACALWWRLRGPTKIVLPSALALGGIALAAAFVSVMAKSGPVPSEYLADYE